MDKVKKRKMSVCEEYFLLARGVLILTGEGVHSTSLLYSDKMAHFKAHIDIVLWTQKFVFRSYRLGVNSNLHGLLKNIKIS